MTRNLGDTTLKRRRRAGDPMRTFDDLPPALRRWLAEASMPWSPASCRRIWQQARSRGEPVEAILARLDRAEARMLASDDRHLSGKRSERRMAPGPRRS
ncbi:DUF6525 family protein [Lutimaribacter marinistellae]|uniref:DUF6525 family protein n=1 Tax=Lutimaribacter marinistellae TaxID=1820329 RepID=A0ABV7TG13_9RHOB